MVTQSRYKASAIHLLISAVVFLTVVGLLIVLWYSAPYYEIEGLWEGLKIAAGVDLILGPLITLIIFKAEKPELKYDLFIIAAVQVAALTYGVSTIYQQRPYFSVFANDSFRTVRWEDVVDRGLSEAELKALNTAASGSPAMVAVLPAASSSEKADMMVEIMNSKDGDYQRLVKRYTQITPNTMSKISTEALKLDKVPANTRQAIEQFCKTLKCDLNQIAVFPLIGRFSEQFIALDRTTGKLVGFPKNSQ